MSPEFGLSDLNRIDIAPILSITFPLVKTSSSGISNGVGQNMDGSAARAAQKM